MRRLKALSLSFQTAQKSSKTDRYRKSYGTIESTPHQPQEKLRLGGRQTPPVLGEIGPYVNPLYSKCGKRKQTGKQ